MSIIETSFLLDLRYDYIERIGLWDIYQNKRKCSRKLIIALNSSIKGHNSPLPPEMKSMKFRIPKNRSRS